MERFTADGEDCINKEWLVFDNEEFYCCFGPTTQLNAVTKARELNEKHAGKDEVSALKTRIAELEKALSHAETDSTKEQDVRDLEQQAKGVDDSIEWLVDNYHNECNPCAGLLGYFKSGLSTKAEALRSKANDYHNYFRQRARG